MRKRDAVAARKPGDMVKASMAATDEALLARANAVLNGEPLPGK